MTNETTPVGTDIQISVEQILASILSLGGQTVPLESLVANYGGKNIAVNQDSETKAVTFTLADIPTEAAEEDVLTTETEIAE